MDQRILSQMNVVFRERLAQMEKKEQTKKTQGGGWKIYAQTQKNTVQDQQKTQNIQQRGLPNIGNTCFLNTFFQIFSMIDNSDIKQIFPDDCVQDILEYLQNPQFDINIKQKLEYLLEKYKIKKEPQDVLDVIDKIWDFMDFGLFTTFRNQFQNSSVSIEQSQMNKRNPIFYFVMEKEQKDLQELIRNRDCGDFIEKINHKKYLLVFVSKPHKDYLLQGQICLDGNWYDILSLGCLQPGHWIAKKFMQDNSVVISDNATYINQVKEENDKKKQTLHYDGLWMLYKRNKQKN